MAQHVLEKVQQARLEVIERYSPDVLGLKGPQWDPSTLVSKSKYTVKVSDDRLSNTLVPEEIQAAELRHTSREVAFTRGDVTVGWDHRTLVSTKDRVRQEDELTRTCREATKQQCKSIKGYISPQQRVEEHMRSMRESKQRERNHSHELEEMYGKEGAGAMLAIENMSPHTTRVQLRASAHELKEVMDLPWDHNMEEEDST